MNEYKLIEACQTGNLQLIKFLVEKGSDISVDDYSPLRYAAWYGHFKVVKYLVEQGADISIYNYQSLSFAIRNGHLEVVKYLRKLAGDKLKCHTCIVAATCMKICKGFIK